MAHNGRRMPDISLVKGRGGTRLLLGPFHFENEVLILIISVGFAIHLNMELRRSKSCALLNAGWLLLSRNSCFIICLVFLDTLDT